MANRVVPYRIPIVEVPSSNVNPTINPFTMASGQSSNDGDIMILTGGDVESVGNNVATGFLGIIQHVSGAVFDQTDSGIQGVFGTDNVNSGLLPADAGQVLVALFGNDAVVAINLNQNTGWQENGTYQATVGTPVAIYKDGTTGIYYADTQGLNTVATVLGLTGGPTTQQSFNGSSLQTIGDGGPGDLGCRVYIKFNPSALALTGGM